MTCIQEWDEWFEATKDVQSLVAWNSAKAVFGLDPVVLDRWATMIELNRLDKIQK